MFRIRLVAENILIVLLLFLSACGNVAVEHGDFGFPFRQQDAVAFQYLQTVIPPCTPLQGVSKDPCNQSPITDLQSAASSSIYGEIPKYWDLYFDPNKTPTIFTPHLVVRATFLPDTTRCSAYERHFPVFTTFTMSSEDRLMMCFVEARANDYLIGTGPPILTLVPYTFPYGYRTGDSLSWIDDDQAEVATAYEGREGIMFLAPASTTAVEGWRVVEFWPIQSGGGKIMVVAPFKNALEQHGLYDSTLSDGTYYRDLTPQELALLEVPLDEFEKTIAAAAVRRATATGGRIGIGDDWPMLITDANLLRPYYEGPGVGIVYETDAPAKPPPAPGGNDPEHRPGRTDDGQDNTPSTSVPLPTDEDIPTQPRDTTTTTSMPDDQSGIEGNPPDSLELPTSSPKPTLGSMNDVFVSRQTRYRQSVMSPLRSNPAVIATGYWHEVPPVRRTGLVGHATSFWCWWR